MMVMVVVMMSVSAGYDNDPWRVPPVLAVVMMVVVVVIELRKLDILVR